MTACTLELRDAERIARGVECGGNAAAFKAAAMLPHSKGAGA